MPLGDATVIGLMTNDQFTSENILLTAVGVFDVHAILFPSSRHGEKQTDESQGRSRSQSRPTRYKQLRLDVRREGIAHSTG